jgi:hypothetical protein
LAFLATKTRDFAPAFPEKAVAKLGFASAILSLADEKGEFAVAEAGFADANPNSANENGAFAEEKRRRAGMAQAAALKH